MNHRAIIVLNFIGWFTFASAAISRAGDPDKVTFDDHVQPIMRAHCANCHNPNKRSGDLDVTTYAAIMQGGSSGSVIEPGQHGDSHLFMLVNHEDEPKMPPNSPKIPQPEVDLIARWIDGGALENSGSKAIAPKANNLAAAVAVDPTARPAEPALPLHLPLEPFVQTERATAVPSLATSPWAPLVAIATPQQVLLYRTDSLELSAILPFPEGQPNIVRFSRDGSLLIAGGGRGAAKGIVAVWDVKSGERLATVGDQFDSVLAADISNDHSQVAMAGPDRLVRVYSTATGKLQYEIKKHTDWVLSVAFSPDGVLLASGDRNGGLQVWEAATGREYLTLRGHTAAITGLSWRLDSNALASSSEDATLRLWEMENGNQFKGWGAHGGGALDVKYCRDGNLISCGRDLVTKLWDQNGQQLRAFPATSDVSVATALADESQRVLTADWQGNVTVWNAADGAPLGSLAANPPRLAERLAAAGGLVQAKQQELAPVETQFVATQNQLAGMKQSLEASKQKMAACQAEIATLQSQIDATNLAMTTWTGEKTAFEAESAQTKEAQPLLAESMVKAQEASQRLPENPDLKKAADAVAEQVKQLEAKLAALATQIAERATQIQAADETLKQMTAAMTQKQTDVAAVGQEIQKMETDIPPVQQLFDGLSQQVAGLRDQVTQAQSFVLRWQNEIAFVQKLAELQQQLTAAQQVIAERQTAFDTAQAAAAQAQTALTAAQANVQQAVSQADEIRRQISEARRPTGPVSAPAAPQ
jgi:predicted  nucleic acid-binding Zn-ribbon protein